MAFEAHILAPPIMGLALVIRLHRTKESIRVAKAKILYAMNPGMKQSAPTRERSLSAQTLVC